MSESATLLPPFKPSAIYIPGLDLLVCLTRDCSYVSVPTDNPYIERLVDKSDTARVGFKICNFLAMPGESRHQVSRLIEGMIDLDDLQGIEYIWIKNAQEQDADMSAGEVEFFHWLDKERAR